jgi:hypothetical protein
MKVKSVYFYPVFIVLLISALFYGLFILLNFIGLRMNPPQPVSVVEEGVVAAVVFRDEGTKTWKINFEGPYEIFETSSRESVRGELISNLKVEALGPISFLIVNTNLIKAGAKTLLEELSRFWLKKVYIASSYDGTLSALKNLEPRFWYSASPRSWVKWSLFSTFGIENVFSLDADFVFVDRKIKNLLSPRLLKEIKRRNLPMIQTHQDGSLKVNEL